VVGGEKGPNPPVLAISDIIEYNDPEYSSQYQHGLLNGNVKIPANTLDTAKQYTVEVWGNNGYEGDEFITPVVGKAPEGRGPPTALRGGDGLHAAQVLLHGAQAPGPHAHRERARRVIAATINGVRVINVYCVNGEALDSPKFQYKEQWFAALTEFVRAEMAAHSKLVLLGDFNIAPADADCYDPEKWHEKIHCSSIERQWFKNLLDLGLIDSLRKIHPEGAFYTWFDYRGAMFQRKLGLRIDHILSSPELAATLTNVTVDLETRAQERPSDHAPVIAEFDC